MPVSMYGSAESTSFFRDIYLLTHSVSSKLKNSSLESTTRLFLSASLLFHGFYYFDLLMYLLPCTKQLVLVIAQGILIVATVNFNEIAG